MAKSEPNLNVNSISRISSGTIIKGEILSPYDIRIDGTFEGKVQTKGRVVVGETAFIKGDIICENIDLWGKVDGNLFVKDTLSLMEGCSVNGNLNVRSGKHNRLLDYIGRLRRPTQSNRSSYFLSRHAG